ncbi:MAG: NUDIX hydrolase [Nocardioides sp.]|jgi:8-oxo-dGTP pyrophosphatase MutT (NUDIX family)/phosphohistidine phosphatase SixA
MATPPSRPAAVSAGAVVLRREQVLLVHRPRYDDWAFPKGKLDRGEHALAAAVREVQEETGVDIRLGPRLTSQRYDLKNGRQKQVHYWVGRVTANGDVSKYAANDEIDAVQWLPVAKAAKRLTYDYDRETLDEALDFGKKTLPLIVLRHGHARQRKNWKRDDRLRPLLASGAAQAEHLVPKIAAYGVERLVCSTSVRCMQTIAPFIAIEGLGLKTEVALSEEKMRPNRIAGVVDSLLTSPVGSVVCSHRPVLPYIFDALGVEHEKLEPGGFVVAHHRDGRVVATELHQP